MFSGKLASFSQMNGTNVKNILMCKSKFFLTNISDWNPASSYVFFAAKPSENLGNG